MKLKLMSASFAMLSLVAHATESQKFDEIVGLTPQETLEMKACAQEMREYSLMTLPVNTEIYLQYEFPSFRCFELVNLTIRNGRLKNNFKTPSQEEYRAWMMAVDHYLRQPFVRKVVEEKQRRARELAQARYPLIHFDLDDYTTQKNYELVRRGRAHLLSLNPFNSSVSSSDSGVRAIADACSAEQKDAAYALKNKDLREQAIAAFNNSCKDADKRIAEAKTAAAKAKAAADSYKLPTEADLLPVGYGQKVTDVEAFFKTPGLLTRTVGADDAKVTMQVILDFDDDRIAINRTRRFLASVWPAVRDGQLKLVIAPTTAASGEFKSNASFLLTKTPYAFIDNWMERGLEMNTSITRVQGSWLRYKQGLSYEVKMTDEDRKQLAAEIEAERKQPQPSDALVKEVIEAIKQTPEQLVRASVRIIPSFRIVSADGSVYPSCVGAFHVGSSPFRKVGVSTPAIYSKAQVAAWSKRFTAYNGSTLTYSVPPFDLENKEEAAVEPDWDNARQVCGGGECWKAPAPKKKGLF